MSFMHLGQCRKCFFRLLKTLIINFDVPAKPPSPSPARRKTRRQGTVISVPDTWIMS